MTTVLENYINCSIHIKPQNNQFQIAKVRENLYRSCNSLGHFAVRARNEAEITRNNVTRIRNSVVGEKISKTAKYERKYNVFFHWEN